MDKAENAATLSFYEHARLLLEAVSCLQESKEDAEEK